MVVCLTNGKNRGIFKVNAETGEAVQLALPDARPVNPQFAPDGKTFTLWSLESRTYKSSRLICIR